jgi:hypothetical protein
MIPVKILGKYVVMFNALPEEQDARNHFIEECGWSEERFDEIQLYDWFMAEVSIWLDAERVAVDYLGACCYEQSSDFIKQADGYFGDMVLTCCNQVRDPELGKQARQWLLRPPAGYTAEELERDSPYNQWMYNE